YDLLKKIGAIDVIKGVANDIGETIDFIDKLVNGVGYVIDKGKYAFNDALNTQYMDAAALRRQAYGAGTAALAGKSTSGLAAPAGAGRQATAEAQAAAEAQAKLAQSLGFVG